MQNFITIENLTNGIREWRTHKNWWQDFDNALYIELKEGRAKGFDADYLELLIKHLVDWKALRPRTKAFIRERGLERLPRLKKEFENIITSYPLSQTDMGNIRWESIHKLFYTAWEIKDVNSPVFASKMCHFLMPRVFMVIDNEFIGVNEPYEMYWKRCQSAWVKCEEKDKYVEILKSEIGENVILDYPWATKITELCINGMKKQ